MKDKRGFTLVEVLAVITVLIVISLVSFPSLIKTIKKNQEASYNAKVKDIILAASTYNGLNGGKLAQISLSDLISSEYIQNDVIDPRDNSKMNGCVYISNGEYSYRENPCYTINSGPKKLSDAILTSNYLIETAPSLTTTSEASNEKGLYVSTLTNSGNPTYYFRGAIDNNYVSFAGYTWRIIRINEDGTVRLIMQNGINNNDTYKYNDNRTGTENTYYSNSDYVKNILGNWYQNNLYQYSKYIAIENFCEQAKTKYDTNYVSDDANTKVAEDYSPQFTCDSEKTIKSEIGLLTYDEVAYAGGYKGMSNNYYLKNDDKKWWTMSSSGTYIGDARVWLVSSNGMLIPDNVFTDSLYIIRPVINLKADVEVIGTGIDIDPYIIK